MLTLGNKEAIVNDPSYFDLTVTGTRCEIKNFGIFDNSKINSAWGARYFDTQYNGLTLECPTADDIGLVSTDKRVPVIVQISISTKRANVETPVGPQLAGNPFRVELVLNGTDDSPTIAGKLIAAFELYSAEFGEGKLPFVWERQPSGNRIWLTSTTGSFYFPGNVHFLTEKAVKLKAETYRHSRLMDGNTLVTLTAGAIIGSTSLTMTSTDDLRVGDTIRIITGATSIGTEITVNSITSSTVIAVDATTEEYTSGQGVYVFKAPMEGTTSGTYLEENVLMGTADNSVPYAISPGETPNVLGKYTAVSFEMNGDSTSSMQGSGYFRQHDLLNYAVDGVSSSSKQLFTLYFNEDTCLETDGPVDKLLTWLDVSANVTLTDTFEKENGNTATSSSDFIA